MAQNINTANGEFNPANPAQGLDATLVTTDWLNTIQGEINNTVTDLGLTLDPNNNRQLSEGLAATYAPLASPSLTGIPLSTNPASNAPNDQIATVGYVNEAALSATVGFTPVQQGGGFDQGSTKVNLGQDTTYKGLRYSYGGTGGGYLVSSYGSEAGGSGNSSWSQVGDLSYDSANRLNYQNVNLSGTYYTAALLSDVLAETSRAESAESKLAPINDPTFSGSVSITSGDSYGNYFKIGNVPSNSYSTAYINAPNGWQSNILTVAHNGVTCFDIDGSQNGNFSNSVTANGNLTVSGTVYANNNVATPAINVNTIDSYESGGNLAINNNVTVGGNFSVSPNSSTYVPTQTTGDYSNKIADTAFVQNTLVAGTGLGFYKGDPGYSVLPGGMIVQSGRNGSGAQGGQTVAFPIAFPTACISVVICEGAAEPTWGENGGQPTVHGIAGGAGQYNFQTYSMRWTGSSFTGQSGLSFTWIAFGY